MILKPAEASLLTLERFKSMLTYREFKVEWTNERAKQAASTIYDSTLSSLRRLYESEDGRPG